MSSKILFVDDDVAVLDSFRRLLGREVEMETAVGGASGLDIIANLGPFAVVISDMRMPEMDGAHFLGKVREIAPSAVRMVLTGHADIATAMEAVRPGGKVLLFAQTQHGEAGFDPGAVCMDEKALIGSYSAAVDIQEEGTTLVFEGYRNGFDLTRLISHRFALEQAVEAIRVASQPSAQSMKIMIEMETQ